MCGSNSGELQNCSNSSTVIGKENEYRIGGVCGYNSGTVKDCKNTGSVRGKETIGGVCGYNERRYNEKGGIIENSFNEGTVSGTGDYDVLNIGGVCGYNYGGTIKSCYNTASVSGHDYVGGVCGHSYGTIKSCYNIASVSGQYSVGGVSGSLGSDVTNCYYLSGTVADGKSGIGGQKDENGKAEKMSLEQFKSGEVAWLLNGSKSVSTEESTLAWYQKLDENADAYPVLKSTDHNTVYKAPLFSCDGTTRIGEYANKPEGDKLSHNYQMAEKTDEGTSNLYSEECAICHN